MREQKIAAALACVVFFTSAWGGVAAGQSQRPLPGPEFGRPVPYEGWEPWRNAPRFSPNAPGMGVPEPGTLVLLLTGGLGLLVLARRRKAAAMSDMLKHNLPG